MTVKAANEARERLLGLLADQHRLGLSAGLELAYAANAVEILKLSKIADLSAVELPPPPPPLPPAPSPFEIHVPVAFNAKAIAAAEARLADILQRKRGRWADDAKFLEAEIALAKRMST
jgi:hypothetical protein